MTANKKTMYADDRAYLNGIKDIMKKTEAELVARLDELRDQMSYVDHALAALSVYEHITPSVETPAEPVNSEV